MALVALGHLDVLLPKWSEVSQPFLEDLLGFLDCGRRLQFEAGRSELLQFFKENDSFFAGAAILEMDDLSVAWLNCWFQFPDTTVFEPFEVPETSGFREFRNDDDTAKDLPPFLLLISIVK